MAGRPSAATERALRLHAKGLSIREAASKARVAPSTLMRALTRQRTKDKPTKETT